MMRKTALIYLPLLASMLTGCMTEITDSPPESDITLTDMPAPISLMTTVTDQQQEGEGTQAGTRTTSTALQSTQFAQGERIYVYFPTNVTVGTTTSASSTTYTTTDDNGATTPATQPYMNSNIQTADIHAYYPSSHRQNTSSFSVLADQTSDDNYKASDLMYAKTSVTKTAAATVTGALTFSHRMAKIIVTATADTGKGVSAVTKVRIIGGYRTATIATPLSCAMKTDDGFSNQLSNAADGGITLYDNSTGAASVSCAGLIPPQTIAEGTAFLEVTVKTAGNLTGTATYSIPAGGKTLATGNAYTCTLSVNLAAIGVTTEIGSWGNGDDTNASNNGTTTLQ